MAFGIGDNLSVRVSAQTGDFERGIEDARDKLSKFRTSAVTTSGSLQLLQGRADEAEDEISSVGRSATTSSLSLTGLSTAAKGAGLSLSGLGTTLVVGLIPTLALLSTALVPITAALGGLAAIVGSIGLVAFAGTLGAVKTNTQLLKQEAQDLVATLKAEFAPFFDTFAVALVTLIDRLQATISELAPTQAEAETLANSLVEIGTAVIDVLPALTDLALSLTQEFLPPLIELARDVLPEVPGFVRGLVDTFRELAPTLSGTGAFLVSLTKELFDLGTTVLTLVTPAFSGVGGAINGLLSAFNDLSGNVRNLSVTIGLLIGPVGVLLSILGGPLTLAVVGISAAIIAFRSELVELATTVGNIATNALNSFRDLLSDIGFSRVRDALSGLAEQFDSSFSLIEDVGLTVLEALQGVFNDNRAEIVRFGKVAERGIAGFLTVLGQLQRVFRFVFGQILAPILLDVIRLIGNRLGPVLNSLSGLFTTVFNVLSAVATKGGQLWSKFGNEITSTARFVGDLIGTTLVTVLDGLITTFQIIVEILQGDFGDAWDTFISLGERTINRFSELLDKWDVVEVLTGIFNSIVGTIKTALTETLPQLFVLGLGLAIASLETLGDKLFNAFIRPFNAIATAVNNIFQGIANGIVDALNGAITKFEDLINNAIDSLPKEVTSKLGFDSVDIENVGDISTTAATQDLRQIDAQEKKQESVREVAVSLGFDVQGEGPLAEFVKQNADAQIEQRERRAKRNTGGPSGV